ncbi:hypothetical protein [Sarcina ventriculi]|uniref:hypothetical protein n=1 Tax=Sarcina ventriculi TaxID=1267 RepID=UPI001C10DD35|nr:hypothetical protein [Sarcina ventriculi]MBU5323562.1 hypothetical protein [Sarcina ventriculi]
MIKSKKMMVSALLLGIMLNSLGSVALASEINEIDNENITISSEIYDDIIVDTEIDEQLINAPASYEYKTTNSITVTPSNAQTIMNDVNNAKRQNTVSAFVKLSGTMLKLAKQPLPGTIVSTVGKLIKSDMNIKATETFAKKVITSNKNTSAQFKLKRFFDGMRMHDWYYYSIIG